MLRESLELCAYLSSRRAEVCQVVLDLALCYYTVCAEGSAFVVCLPPFEPDEG